MVKAIEWVDSAEPSVRLIDQTLLPVKEQHLNVTEVDTLIDAIQRLAVRGAPALGVAGAFGVVVALDEAERKGWSLEETQNAIDAIAQARPTAVNLAWGVQQVRGLIPKGRDAVLEKALQIQSEDEAANRKLSKYGAEWILKKVPSDQPRAVTHCNTGALATSAWGTAYGIIHELHNRGQLGLVYADETRPLLQGSRLTSWELEQDGIDHVVQVDGAASSTILRGLVDFAVIGADRITKNGDTANKIGSVALALACKRANIPFVVAAPFSTVDLDTETGDDIEIEERGPAEVLYFGEKQTGPSGTTVFNPAFDVTPHDLISAIVTERGVVEPTNGGTMADLQE
ncbi:MAG: S-methyl-5-thioribose-1-phosphate isomerase [Canibacter sp.]